MERLKRHKLKKQAKIRTILAWLIGVGGTPLFVMIAKLVYTPPPPLVHDSFLFFVMLSFFILSPIIVGLILGLSAQGKRDLLRDERNRMYREKDEMYFSMFTKKIKDGDYNDADISDLHNLMSGQLHSLASGMFLSLKLIKGDDRDRNKAIESIDQILKTNKEIKREFLL